MEEDYGAWDVNTIVNSQRNGCIPYVCLEQGGAHCLHFSIERPIGMLLAPQVRLLGTLVTNGGAARERTDQGRDSHSKQDSARYQEQKRGKDIAHHKEEGAYNQK